MMTNMTRSDDDAEHSLLEIARYHRKPIVSLLLDSQESQVPQQKFLDFIKKLECFYLVENRKRKRPGPDGRFQSGEPLQRTSLYRKWINAFDEKNYVALSYTWDPSEHENQSSGRFQIQKRDGSRFFPSPVRDCIFERVNKYMRKFDVNFLWIDRHSIIQNTCRRPVCNHRKCDQKRAALQTMDLVYKLSNHPVALLGRPIESRDELNLLHRILDGELVNRTQQSRQYRLSTRTSHVEAKYALKLLANITSDCWWTRAWTFQENYRAGKKMSLLIRHPRRLEKQKRQHHLFGDIPGEICINSVQFSYQATRLCLAIQPQTQEERKEIDHVLSTAGKYTVLLEGSDPMSPIIIADIEKRSLKDPWDRLAITANCCQYQTRLSIGGLRQKAQSRSLSTLTMCLLNGEILQNNAAKATNSSVTKMTVSKYLKTQLFNEFCAPKGERSLTFNKGCRFIDVELEKSGIMTKGHLWKLSKIIQTATFSPRLPRVQNPDGSSFTLHQRKRLTQLANELEYLSHSVLADLIEEYLHHDLVDNSGDQFWGMTFPRSYLRMMMIELVTAIDEGKALRLGSIIGDMKKVTPYTAIFVWNSKGGEEQATEGGWDEESEAMETGNESQGNTGTEGDQRQKIVPAFVFTASRPENPTSDLHGTNDIDRHVSLEVKCEGLTSQVNNCVPRLYIKRWLLGLCFFKRHPRMDVIFPWPPTLKDIVPA